MLYGLSAGALGQLSTVLWDADSATPDILYEQFCGLVVKHGHTLDAALPLLTTNAATALRLERKGKLVSDRWPHAR